MSIENCVDYLRNKGYNVFREKKEEKEEDYLQTRNEYLTEVINLFGDISNKCILKNVFKNIKKLVSDSASKSSIFLAKYKGKIPKKSSIKDISVAVKMAYTSDDRFDNGLDIERQIYKYIIPELNNHTPSLLYCYSTYKCIDTKFNNELLKLYKGAKKKKKINDIQPSANDVSNFLVLEKTSGNKLFDLIKNLSKDKDKQDENLDMLISVVFQILWTFKCFYRINMRHNDLHLNNIFIETLPENITINYELESGQVVSLNTKHLVRIFDFDRSSVVGNKNIDRNMFIDFYHCQNHYECNYIDDKYDVFRFMTDLYTSLVSKKIVSATIFMKYINKVILDTYYEPQFPNNIPDNVILPLSKCIDELVIYSDNIDKSPLTISKDHHNKYIYKLPEEKSIEYIQIKNDVNVITKGKKLKLDELNNKLRNNLVFTGDNFETMISNLPSSIFKNWDIELYNKYDYDWYMHFLILLQDIYGISVSLNNMYGDAYKSFVDINDEYFLISVVLLSCPMFHKLRIMDEKASPDEKGFVDKIIYKSSHKKDGDIKIKNYIDEIWKLYNNHIELFDIPFL